MVAPSGIPHITAVRYASGRLVEFCKVIHDLTARERGTISIRDGNSAIGMALVSWRREGRLTL